MIVILLMFGLDWRNKKKEQLRYEQNTNIT
jgi:hypothetical protein